MRVDERCYSIEFGLLTVRVWATATDLRSSLEETEQRAAIMTVLEIVQTVGSSLPQKVLAAEKMAVLPFVNAVEVKARGDNAAVLIYPEWP